MQKKRILLIDDEPDVTGLLKLNLENTGAYEVREENRAEHALATARTFKPDLIILDIVMPGMDGYEVMKALKRNPGTADIPVVVLTGVEIDGSHVRALSLGASGFVIKAGGLGKLFEAIETVLSGQSSG